MFVKYTLFDIYFLDGLSVQTVVGMLYNPFSGYWHWSENTSLNYAAHALKSSLQEHPVPAQFSLKRETEELQAEASTNSGVQEELKKWTVSKGYSIMAWKSDVYKYTKYILFVFWDRFMKKKSIKRVKTLE